MKQKTPKKNRAKKEKQSKSEHDAHTGKATATRNEVKQAEKKAPPTIPNEKTPVAGK